MIRNKKNKINSIIKITLKISLIFILIIIYAYITSITLLPRKVILIEGEDLKFKTIYGVKIKEKDKSSVEVISNNEKEKLEPRKKVLEVSLFNNIKAKEIDVTIIDETKVIPLGNSVGLKVYTEGVLVVGTTKVEGKDKKIYRPCEESNIKEGDIITKVNDIEINKVTQLINLVNESQGKTLEIKCISKDNIEKEIEITPIEVDNHQFKLGLWARDVAAGVGTLTLYNTNTEEFAALGHGISDIDTENLIKIESGELVTTSIHSIIKGEKGKSGIMKGSLNDKKKIGEIYKNTSNGIFGKITDKIQIGIDYSKEISVAKRNEIKEGPAIILTQLDSDKVEQYNIEIEKVYTSNNSNNKSMVIKITDPKLLEKTGGIIQGMSGSPIIQDNKFVGAVTHVLLENPEKGYAIFADLMIKQMSKI